MQNFPFSWICGFGAYWYSIAKFCNFSRFAGFGFVGNYFLGGRGFFTWKFTGKMEVKSCSASGFCSFGGFAVGLVRTSCAAHVRVAELRAECVSFRTDSATAKLKDKKRLECLDLGASFGRLASGKKNLLAPPGPTYQDIKGMVRPLEWRGYQWLWAIETRAKPQTRRTHLTHTSHPHITHLRSTVWLL